MFSKCRFGFITQSQFNYFFSRITEMERVIILPITQGIDLEAES